MSRPAADWEISTKGRPPTSEDGETSAHPGVEVPGETTASSLKPPRRLRCSGSRVLPGLMLLLAYGFAYRAIDILSGSEGALSPGYEYMLILTGVPFLLAAHGFAVVRWRQLRTLDAVQGTVRDITTDVSLSAWEIFFCWLGISASLMFLYYAAPVAEFEQWYPRFFLVLVVFFGATYQKALVFVFALLPFVVTLTAVSMFLFYSSPGEGFLGANPDAIAAACFLAADVAVLLWAVKLTSRHGGFRVCEFQMPLGAGFAGGELYGVIRTRQKSMPEGGFQLQLSCVQQYKEGDRKRQGQVLWHAQKTVRGDLSGTRHADTSIPVSFAIPPAAPATSTDDEDNRVTWTLRATAALPETDFSCWFEVPVRRDEDPAQSQHATHFMPEQVSPILDRIPATWGDGHGGITFAFKTSWNRASELVTVAYFLFWFQLVWLATSHQIGWETWGIFGVGFWFLGWAMLPWTSRSEVTMTDAMVKIVNHSGLLKQTHTVTFADIQDIVAKPSSLRSGLIDGLDFYQLELQQAGGKSIIAGRHLRDRARAKSLASRMRDLIVDRS